MHSSVIEATQMITSAVSVPILIYICFYFEQLSEKVKLQSFIQTKEQSKIVCAAHFRLELKS